MEKTKKKAQKSAQKIAKGQFDLADMREQLLQMEQMGGMEALMDKKSISKEPHRNKELEGFPFKPETPSCGSQGKLPYLM